MIRFLNIMILITTVFFSGCSESNFGDCFTSTGRQVSEPRTLNAFNAIELYDNVDLVIIQDTFYHAEVTAGENIIDRIRVRQERNLVKIMNENSCNWVRSFKKRIEVRIYTKNLKNLTFHGSGSIRTEGQLRMPEFYFDNWEATGSIDLDLFCPTAFFNMHTGPADLKVRGQGGIVTLYAAGFAVADLRELNAGYYYINSRGTGDFRVTCTEELEAKIAGSGSIYYSGDPNKVVVIENTGTGELIKE